MPTPGGSLRSVCVDGGLGLLLDPGANCFYKGGTKLPPQNRVQGLEEQAGNFPDSRGGQGPGRGQERRGGWGQGWGPCRS